jgi:hypothetical protein
MFQLPADVPVYLHRAPVDFRLTWHGKGPEAVETLKSLHDMIGLAPEDAACRALWWNRRGMPISSCIAESAVNEVVSLRCAKKRQMRWTNKGHTFWFRFG